jgi:drug/metabolite transporter (DMT)-like permease
MGWLFLGETFTLVQYAASILILLGVFVSGRGGRKASSLAGEDAVETEEYN